MKTTPLVLWVGLIAIIALGVVFIPLDAKAQSQIYSQTFEPLISGVLVPQDGWQVDTNVSFDPVVVASTSCFASKCLKLEQGVSGSDIIERDFESTDYLAFFSQINIYGNALAGNVSPVWTISDSASTTAFFVLRALRDGSTSNWCFDFRVAGGATEQVICGIEPNTNNLFAIYIDLRNHPTSCHINVDVNFLNDFTYSDTSCGLIEDVVNQIETRQQGSAGNMITFIDNVVLSVNPQFITFSTTTAPFESTNLDQFCGEIGTSTSFIESIGASFTNGLCRTFAFFFIPNTIVLDQYALIPDQMAGKFPFSWILNTRDIYSSVTASTSDNFVELSYDFGSTTSVIGLGNVEFISTTTVSKYLPDSVRQLLLVLLAGIFYLTALSFIYWNLQGIWNRHQD